MMEKQAELQDKRIPIHIITGFLGAGKTSFLNSLLQEESLKNSAVIVNEFGAISLDHFLLEKIDDTIIALNNGCLCCTMRGDLLDSLSNLIEKWQQKSITKPERVFIETTGLADPAPLLQAFLAHPLLINFFQIGPVFTLIDALKGQETLVKFAEARRQIRFADHILLTKSDLVEPKTQEALCEKISALNPYASFKQREDFCLSDLEAGAHYQSLAHLSVQASSDLMESQHEKELYSFALSYSKGLSFAGLEALMAGLEHYYGSDLVRVKGVVRLDKKNMDASFNSYEMSDNTKIDPAQAYGAQKEQRSTQMPEDFAVIHAVQGHFHPPLPLPLARQEEALKTGASFFVFIVENIKQKELTEFVDQFFDIPRVDQADRQACLDNPLAIPALKF